MEGDWLKTTSGVVSSDGPETTPEVVFKPVPFHNRHMRRFWLAALIVGFSACSLKNVTCGVPAPPETQSTAPAAPAAGSSGRRVAVSPEDAPKTRIAFLGDSLTAGLRPAQPSRPTRRSCRTCSPRRATRSRGRSTPGSSGDTTRRRRAARRAGPRAGRPDSRRRARRQRRAPRADASAQTHDNLATIIETARRKGVAVMLVRHARRRPISARTIAPASATCSSQLAARVPRSDHRSCRFCSTASRATRSSIRPTASIRTSRARKIIAELLYPKLRDMVDQLPSGGGHGPRA